MVMFYSQRMLNPYHGIMNVVETDVADAVCSDGVNWTLYVHDEPEPVVLDDGTVIPVDTPDIKFGIWCEQHGLKRAPVRDASNYEFVDHVGRHLLEQVKQAIDRLPFPQQDRFELWLLDEAFDLPLALLHSVTCEDEIRTDHSLVWRPGLRASRSFRVEQSLSEQFPEQGALSEAVMRLVNAAAGRRPRAQWFERDAQGGGTGLNGIHIDPAMQGRTLPLRAFPEQLLRSHWPNNHEQALIRAFLDWQAPWLLQLQHINDETRDRLEQAAMRQALLLEKCYRLYPKTICNDRITAARVEAQMRHGAGESLDDLSVSDALFPFFNE